MEMKRINGGGPLRAAGYDERNRTLHSDRGRRRRPREGSEFSLSAEHALAPGRRGVRRLLRPSRRNHRHREDDEGHALEEFRVER